MNVFGAGPFSAKHHILMEPRSFMVISSNTFGLPLLEVNPFNSMPLEAGDERHLVARDAEFLELKNYLKYQSPRRILLVGSFGSGRTSLLRCLQPHASTYASVEHLRAQAPGDALLRDLHAQLVGTQAPIHHADLVKSLVDACFGFANGLPLIVIDVPASDTSVLNVALRDSLAVLERLRALVVLVCEPHERRQLPQNVAGLFDEIRLEPFGPQEVVRLVEHRLAAVGVSSLDFTTMDAEALLARCDGSPLAVLTLLRNAVDAVRMGSNAPEPSNSALGRAKILPRDEPYALGVLSGSAHPPVPSDHRVLDGAGDPQGGRPPHPEGAAGGFDTMPLPSQVDAADGALEASPSVSSSPEEASAQPLVPHDSASQGRGVAEGQVDAPGNGVNDAFPSALLDPLDPVIFDASTPWTERVEPTPSLSPPSDRGFELDFDGLSRAQAEDGPLPPLPGPSLGSGIIDASSVAPLPKGVFSKLAERNRSVKEGAGAHASTAATGSLGLGEVAGGSLADPSDDVDAWAKEGLVREIGDDGGEFWVVPGSLYVPDAIEPDDPLPKPPSSMDDGAQETLPSAEVPGPFFADSQDFDGPEAFMPAASHLDAGRLDEVHEMLSTLVMALKPDQSASLLSYFEARQRPARGPKDVHPLNHIALNQLNLREAYVVEQARQRWISPSDETVLAHLGVQRSRLSQMCNRLLRFGILEAQREGRYRKYQLTKAAEAQLIAWGALEEVVV